MIQICPNCKSENFVEARSCSSCGLQLDVADDLHGFHSEVDTPPLEALEIGSQFADRYEVQEELGHGGMGKVYRVKDLKSSEELALKLLKPEISTDRHTIERFSYELNIARHITHENICRLFHLGEAKNTYYITMELVRGDNLCCLISDKQDIPLARVFGITLQTCEGLAEAHKHAIVHRDLKSSNIMVDKNGHTWIMDLGIARSFGAGLSSDKGVKIGTPAYMAPEQVAGKVSDPRADIYALGIILFEMVTGRVPFRGQSPLEISTMHINEIPPEPQDLNPQVPDSMNALILKCLEKDVNKRFQSIEEVRVEVRRIAGDLLVIPVVPSATGLKKFFRAFRSKKAD